MNANAYIIAGPNGAGKTTFIREFLPRYAHCREFLNADLLAAGISPFDPDAAAIAAGRIVLTRMRELIPSVTTAFPFSRGARVMTDEQVLIRQAEQAMQDAADGVVEEAKRTHGTIVVWENGAVRHIRADELPEKEPTTPKQ